MAARGAELAHGRRCASWSLIGRVKPAAVVGFGGYPTVPPVLAAALRGMPTVIHEQNGVLGRANRLLAPRVAGHRHRLSRGAGASRARLEAKLRA